MIEINTAMLLLALNQGYAFVYLGWNMYSANSVVLGFHF